MDIWLHVWPVALLQGKGGELPWQTPAGESLPAHPHITAYQYLSWYYKGLDEQKKLVDWQAVNWKTKLQFNFLLDVVYKASFRNSKSKIENIIK